MDSQNFLHSNEIMKIFRTGRYLHYMHGILVEGLGLCYINVKYSVTRCGCIVECALCHCAAQLSWLVHI
jgi:hypothetical protein